MDQATNRHRDGRTYCEMDGPREIERRTERRKDQDRWRWGGLTTEMCERHLKKNKTDGLREGRTDNLEEEQSEGRINERRIERKIWLKEEKSEGRKERTN